MGSLIYQPPAPSFSSVTEQVTLVRRSRIDVGADANINPNTALQPVPAVGIDAALDEIPLTLNGNNFVIPAITGARFEVEFNLNLDSTGTRTNFITHLTDAGGVSLQSIHGQAYGRNTGGHGETSLDGVFAIETPGEYGIATSREAAAGDVDLDGDSWIIVRAYIEKTITFLIP